MKKLLEDMDPSMLVDSAANYNEAFEVFAASRPDLIILDIRLPGENGISFLRKIRKTGAECKVIMNSNYASDYYRQQCLDLGANYFLDKTHEFEILPDLVRKYAIKPIGIAS